MWSGSPQLLIAIVRSERDKWRANPLIWTIRAHGLRRDAWSSRFCLALGTWAAYASITGAIIAAGIVSVESKVKTVQHLTGGIVSKINVSEGDQVEAGTVLIRLDETVIRANLAVTTGELYEYKAQKARLEAERDASTELRFDDDLTNQTGNGSLKRILKGQQSLFEARRASRLGEEELFQQQIEQLAQEVVGLEAQLASKKSQISLIDEEIADVEPLFKKGLTSKSRLLALKREKARIEGEAGKHLSDIARTRGTIREVDLKILKAGIDFHEEVLTLLRSIQLKIVELEERKITLIDQLKQTEIRAPLSGKVLNLAVHTIGGIVSPATTILQIVPDEDRLIIEARVTTSDVDQLFLNQPAMIQLSAFDSRTTPQLSAKVIKISADRIVDKATGSDFYIVNLALDEGQLERLGGDTLLTGMPAEVFISTGDRTVLDILLKPLTNQLTRSFRAG